MARFLKILKITVVLISALAAALALTVAAGAKTYEWDGKSEMTAGNTYVVSEDKTVKINGVTIIPADATLVVRGTAQFVKGSSLNIKGRVAVPQSGTLSSSGTVFAADGAVFDVYGTALLTLSSTFNLKGEMTVYRQGTFKSSGIINIYTQSYLHVRGYAIFLSSSNVKSSALIEVIKGAQLHIQGNLAVTVSGALDNAGYLTIGRNAVVISSGVFTIREDADYTRFGKLTITVSGVFTDQRNEVELVADDEGGFTPVDDNKYTVSILIDEPAVKLYGIDVSFAQENINWKKVAGSGVEFAILRAGSGKYDKYHPIKVDDYFMKNIKGATENGIDVGVYFYSYATTVAQVKKEAEFFVKSIQDCGYPVTYPLILDMEEEVEKYGLDRNTVTSMVEAFLGIVEEAGYYPMLYSSKNWFEKNLDMRVLDKYAIWLAQYNDSVTYQGGYYIWQYSSKGTVSGIDEKYTVDLNISYRDFADIIRKNGLNNLE